MITLFELHHKALRQYKTVLQAYLTGQELFPMVMPSEKSLDKRAGADAIFEQQRELIEQSKNKTGRGYALELKLNAKTGQSEICKITFETLDDFLFFIDKETDTAQFMVLVDQTRQQVPELESWLGKYPLRLLDNVPDWTNWLTICQYFRDVYEPDLYYVRQLPLPVHTKFLEECRNLLLSLLSVVRPGLLRTEYKDWRKRLGLLIPEPMIRVRALDNALRLDGKHEDFGLPLSAFARHIQPACRIFICENLLNFLTFPAMPNAVAIWSGGGFNIECLAEVEWLGGKEIGYWGDLDAHGFQILNQCKGYFPKTRTLLMDQATFDRHKHLKGAGKKTDVNVLPHLTNDEQALFNLLKHNNWRIEQERLEREWVNNELLK